jgi:hypothetical protein
MTFEPTGLTRNEDIPSASSVVDYVARYLESVEYASLERHVQEETPGNPAVIQIKPGRVVINGTEMAVPQEGYIVAGENDGTVRVRFHNQSVIRGDLCPTCGVPMHHEDGCSKCPSCGNARCG